MGTTGENNASIRISATTLGDMLLNAWDRAPEKEALVFPDRRKSYDQVVQAAFAKARGLMALGVKPGDHVGILLPSGIEFVETLFASAMCGAVSVLMNARYKAPEVAYVAENADLTVIVTNDLQTEHVDFIRRLSEAFPDLATATDPSALTLANAPLLKRIVRLGGSANPAFVDQAAFEAAASRVSDDQLHRRRLGVRIRDTAMILHTSGTSANPKGCLLSHEAVTREASNLGRNRWGFTEDERSDVGGTFIGQPHFEPGESLRPIAAKKVPDRDEARRFYTLFGLDVRDKDGAIELYTKDNPHRWAVITPGVGAKRLRYLSFGFFEDEVDAFRKHLESCDVRFIDAPAGAESNGIWFESFDGLPGNVRVGEKKTPNEKSKFSFTSYELGKSGAVPNSKAPKVHPRRLSHFALFCSDVPAGIAYYEKTLGQRLSDKSRPAVVMSDRRGMHHNSWDVGSVIEVGLGGSTMERAGFGQGGGLGQHVLGANDFYYVRDPWGSYSEYSADIDYVPHDVDWEAGDHPPEDSMFLWGPNPPPEFIQNFEPALETAA